MASFRRLPSGNWQASVLMDDGKRTTKVHEDAEEAFTWAHDLEAERNRVRAEKRALDESARVAVAISTIRQLAERGQLTEKHRAILADIIKEKTSA